MDSALFEISCMRGGSANRAVGRSTERLGRATLA